MRYGEKCGGVVTAEVIGLINVMVVAESIFAKNGIILKTDFTISITGL